MFKDAWIHSEGKFHTQLLEHPVVNIPGILVDGFVDVNSTIGRPRSCGVFNLSWILRVGFSIRSTNTNTTVSF